MKHPVFCDSDFFDTFIDKLSGVSLVEYLNGDDDYGIDLYRLLFSSSIIHTNLTNDEIVASKNPYINKLRKNQSIKTSEIYETINDETFSIDKIHPSSIFLIGRNKIEVNKLQEKYGLFFISKDEMSKSKELFKLKSNSFSSRNPFRNFDFFKQYQHPCNALILTDDYFFSNRIGGYDENSVEKNLKPILKRLLPEILAIDFHFTIILSPNGTNLDFVRIKSDIEVITRTYSYEIKINFIKSNFHERHIFTNFYKITTDKGFKNLVKDTNTDNFKWEHPKNSFEFRSIFYSISKDNDYIEKIEQCKFLDNEKSKEGDNFTNRLLSPKS